MKKELELKEKELALKEKELALKEKSDSLAQKITQAPKNQTSNPKSNTVNENHQNGPCHKKDHYCGQRVYLDTNIKHVLAQRQPAETGDDWKFSQIRLLDRKYKNPHR